MAEGLPLPAQLSAAFVAMAIEIDNTAEQHIPHHTTSFGGSGERGSVWLTSIAMWFTAVRALTEESPLRVADVRERTGLDTNVDGLRRWGYITVDGVGRRLEDRKRPIPKPSSVLALTGRGRDAAAVWAPLPAEVEQRWRDRFGRDAIDRLRAALSAVTRPEDRGLPDYLPILGVGLWAERHRAAPLRVMTGDAADDGSLPLITLLARVLLALTLDYEADARLALPVWANGLRLLAGSDALPVPVRELPARAGVATDAMAMVLTHLQRAACVDVTPLPGHRGKQAQLTERGQRGQAAGARRFVGLGHDGSRGSGAAIEELRLALDALVGDGTRGGSPLFTGLDPAPENWRADVPPPERLPWHPLVLHRGGYPDGS